MMWRLDVPSSLIGKSGVRLCCITAGPPFGLCAMTCLCNLPRPCFWQSIGTILTAGRFRRSEP